MAKSTTPETSQTPSQSTTAKGGLRDLAAIYHEVEEKDFSLDEETREKIRAKYKDRC